MRGVACNLHPAGLHAPYARTQGLTGILRGSAMVFLLLAMALSSITQAQARHAAYGAQTMVICTGYGLVRITLDADGNPVEQSLPCPDCVLGAPGLLVAGSGVSPISLVASTARPTPRRTLVAGPTALVWHDSRAPPPLV